MKELAERLTEKTRKLGLWRPITILDSVGSTSWLNDSRNEPSNCRRRLRNDFDLSYPEFYLAKYLQEDDYLEE